MAVAYVLKGPGAQVVVSYGSNEFARYSLSQDVDVILENPATKGTNHLIIKDGKASVVDASCPDHICVNMPSISKAGDSIICLPNELIVEVVSDNPEDQNDYDVISQ